MKLLRWAVDQNNKVVGPWYPDLLHNHQSLIHWQYIKQNVGTLITNDAIFKIWKIHLNICIDIKKTYKNVSKKISQVQLLRRNYVTFQKFQGIPMNEGHVAKVFRIPKNCFLKNWNEWTTNPEIYTRKVLWFSSWDVLGHLSINFVAILQRRSMFYGFEIHAWMFLPTMRKRNVWKCTLLTKKFSLPEINYRRSRITIKRYEYERARAFVSKLFFIKINYLLRGIPIISTRWVKQAGNYSSQRCLHGSKYEWNSFLENFHFSHKFFGIIVFLLS